MFGWLSEARSLRLALEAGQALGIGGDRLRQHLERDVAAEPRVGRAVDLAHAARAEGRHDGVGTEAPACLKAHAGQRARSAAWLRRRSKDENAAPRGGKRPRRERKDARWRLSSAFRAWRSARAAAAR